MHQGVLASYHYQEVRLIRFFHATTLFFDVFTSQNALHTEAVMSADRTNSNQNTSGDQRNAISNTASANQRHLKGSTLGIAYSTT